MTTAARSLAPFVVYSIMVHRVGPESRSEIHRAATADEARSWTRHLFNQIFTQLNGGRLEIVGPDGGLVEGWR